MPGREFLEAIRDGELPAAPIQDLMGFRLVEVEDGRVAFRAEPGEQHYNPIGVVHGGLAATLLDSAMGASVHSTLPLGTGYSTLETKFNLVRAVTAESGSLLAEGRVVHRGSPGGHRRGTDRARGGRQARGARHLHLPGAGGLGPPGGGGLRASRPFPGHGGPRRAGAGAARAADRARAGG